MGEFFSALFAPVNLLYTGLFILMLLYWASVIIGALDMDSLDVHAHMDADVDVDADVDADMDAHVDADVDADVHAETDAQGHLGHSGGVVYGMLRFFNVGEIPLMIMLSFTILFMWAGAFLVHHYLGIHSLLVGLALFVPYFIGALLVAKVVTTPLKALFKSLKKQTEQHEELMGRDCVVTTSEVNGEFGQAEVKTQGSPLLLNVRTEHGQVLVRGDEAIITHHLPSKSIYIVQKV
jgi:hypothetical protein